MATYIYNALTTDETNKTFISTFSEVQPDSKLLPKKLRRWSKKSRVFRHFALALAWACILTGCIMYGLSAFFMASQQNVTDFRNDLCDKQASSITERRFVIDLRFDGNFSFTQAKLIDVAWDLIFGQGGRFLHAWILFRFVVADALVWTMERSAVPYHYYTNLAFSTISLPSLASLIRHLGDKPGWRTTSSGLWMLFAITYVLAFPTIWSAATGYLNPTTRVYRMPDNSLVSLNSEALALCWSVTSSNSNSIGAEEIFELGPTFDRVYGSSKATSYDIWGNLDIEYKGNNPALKGSDAFRDLYAYARTKRDLQFYFNSTGVRKSFSDASLTSPSNASALEMVSWKDTIDFILTTPQFDRPPSAHLPRYLKGWQYSGIHQSIVPLDDDTAWKSRDINQYEASFVFDTSIQPGPGIVPYNSTLWFKSEEYSLGAPFLELGKKCRGHNNVFTDLGNCVCYRGKIIEYDWYSNDNMLCVGSRNFIWGFSSFLTLIALALESVWVIGCWAVWLDANINSLLLKHRRIGAGTLRSVLDLAEVLNKEFGSATCAYDEESLEKALKNRDHIGYSVEERNNGVKHIGLVSESVQRRITCDDLNEHNLYGKKDM